MKQLSEEEESDHKSEYQGVTTVQSMQLDICACGYILSEQFK